MKAGGYFAVHFSQYIRLEMVVFRPIVRIMEIRVEDPNGSLSGTAIDFSGIGGISGIEMAVIVCVVAVTAIDGGGQAVTDIAGDAHMRIEMQRFVMALYIQEGKGITDLARVRVSDIRSIGIAG